MDNIINKLREIKVLMDILERQFTLSGGIGDNITYTPQQFKELLNKVDALLGENDRLKKDVAYWHNESDVHFEDLCKKGEQLRKVIDKTCEWVNENKQPVFASETDDTIVGYCISVERFLEWLKEMEEQI